MESKKFQRFREEKSYKQEVRRRQKKFLTVSTQVESTIMGASFSSSKTNNSYLQYSNDFELVIRATKDLEHLLETGFGAPSGKNVGLHDKISAAQESHHLTAETVKQLRYLVTVRNKLVHEHNFNQLPDRKHFAKSYDSVERELKEKLKGSSSGGSCVLM